MNSEEIEKILAELGELGGAEDPGIDGGRNIRAGYARGRGLEMGHLVGPILTDPDWMAAWEATKNRSILLPHRLMNLFMIIKYSSVQDGNIIEFGCYNGGSAILMAMLAKRLRPGCKVYSLDTFEGMPKTDGNLDWHVEGSFAGPKLEELQEFAASQGLDNLIFLKGFFVDTVEQIPPEDRRFFLSHVDCDIYESVNFSIDYSKKHAVDGSYIVFDDPLTSDCLGAMKAVEEKLIHERMHAEQMYPHLVFRYPPLGRRSFWSGLQRRFRWT